MPDIATGLVTSAIGAGCGWLWERAKGRRTVNRRAAFFGVRPGEHCLIVLGAKHDAPRAAAYRDVRTVVELARLTGELGCDITLETGDFRGGNGDRTEFCVGGPLPGANPRTAGHLATHLPGVVVHGFDAADPDPAAIEVGGRTYRCRRGDEEYALVARFTPAESARPVFLIAGQTSMANLAAVHFLRREHARLAGRLSSAERFCALIKVSGVGTYAYHHAELEAEVTAAAFAR
nr:hypothetical protein [Streptomyces sp. SID5468]